MAESEKTVGSRFDRSLTEGPVLRGVWKLAWPAMLQNMVAGLQGIIDHAMVGHFVGFVGNAAIGVSWQIFLVVIVFIASLFTGMGILVARFVGARDEPKVRRVVYQAFLTVIALWFLVLAPLGYFLSPRLLDLVAAAPEVQAEALPYLRILFVFSLGNLLFFMLSGALRAAGDSRTPLRLGLVLTFSNMVFNVILIRGLGPIPAFGTRGAAIGTVLAGLLASGLGLYQLLKGRLVIAFPRDRAAWKPDLEVIRSLFRFGLPTGIQGIAMNVGGVLLLRFVGSLEQSAEAQAAYTVGYAQLFSLIAWTSSGLMGATAAMAGQNLGALQPDRARQSVFVAAGVGLGVATAIGSLFLLIPGPLLAFFGMKDPVVTALGKQLLGYLAVSAPLVAVALAFTGGLQGTGDTRSPMVITLVAQLLVPIGLCASLQAAGMLTPAGIWSAIVLGHFLRASLSVARFRQGHWRGIEVSIGDRV